MADATVAVKSKLPREMLKPSKRARGTDASCVVKLQQILEGKSDVMSLAQGIVHWRPPSVVPQAAAKAAEEADTNSYAADEGLPELREALQKKLKEENALKNVRIMVTAGANQAYTNLVLALIDAEDEAVLFAPYYFNHLMAIQMAGGGDRVVFGPVGEDFLPDLDWLENRLSQKGSAQRIKMVTIVNPSNPTGLMMPAKDLERLSAICAAHDVWLIVDNTYENFTYDNEGFPAHSCVEGEHVVNVFSFSKSYGMMGWRVGYLAYPDRLHCELMKIQDTIAICTSVMSQKAALAALELGSPWVADCVRGLAENRRIVRGTLEEILGPKNVIGGSGAIYFMARLPVEDDFQVVEWLVEKHRICVIPGSSCGAPGMVRVAYANVDSVTCREAVARLRAGLVELKERGSSAMQQ